MPRQKRRASGICTKSRRIAEFVESGSRQRYDAACKQPYPTGLVQNGLNVMGRFVSPDFATFSTGGTTSFEIDGYGTPTGPSTFGSGGATFSDSTSGDQFGMIGGNVLAVPNGYVSNTPLFGTSTYNGATFNSLGMVPGTYVWTWGQGESFTLFIGDAIPEPATASICMTLSVAGLLLRRRRR